MTTDQRAVLDSSRPGARTAPFVERASEWPWWLLVTILIGLVIVFQILTNARMSVVFGAIAEGLRVTLLVSLSSYALALVIGLMVGLGRVSNNKLVFNLSSFYVEVVRGVPILVLLMYISFVGVPALVGGVNWVGRLFGPDNFLAALGTRNFDFTLRVIIGLAIAYGAFEAEIFRAGIQSIEKGQVEAARALGMSYIQSMRYVILPQAVRRVMPALGNDFIAMVKDSSLVSVLGVRDITQLTKLYAASTFLYFQAYSILAFMYLTMTILLTRGVRAIEARLSRHRQ